MPSAISGVTYDPSLGAARVPKQSLDSEAFLNLLVAQLRFQDPLSGMDQQAFMNQLASMSSMQQQVEINQQLAQLVTGSQFTEAVSLIGRTVSGTAPDGTAVSGVVDSVVSSDQGAVLRLGQQSLLFSSLEAVE